MAYMPSDKRYDTMLYRRTGQSGLKLPAISLGLWHNFGHTSRSDTAREMCRAAFDMGITHFDLANNYGPPPGSAETLFGTILKSDFRDHRDEMVISTKAGYLMWPGPYGEWGSRKYLISSLDQSLKRMGLDYVDIFYSHRFDPDTPLEETMGALDAVVRQGKALYVGISSYSSQRTHEAAAILRRLGTPAIIHQPSYSIVNRWTEEDRLLDALEEEGMGCIAFSPLAQGLLTDKYLKGVPADSRAGRGAELVEGRVPQRGESRLRARPQRSGQGTRPVAGADGARLGAARQPHDLGADRRQPRVADRGRGEGARQSLLHASRTRRHRPARARGRHQHLEAVEQLMRH